MSRAIHEMVDRNLDGYRITGVLGTGGMAVVFRAQEPGGAEVALKMLRDGGGDSDAAQAARARFTREVEQARGLEHPNLIRVHASGEVDGSPYYVMDRIEGSTLEQYLKGVERPPFDDAVHVLKGILKGLAYLHSKNLVHRDLKPSNVFLVGRQRRVVLGDFGLLKPLEMDDLTAANERIGTPAYMSPEQFKGGRIDTRSDIYQLGVLLYRLMTGRVPFADDNFFRLGTMHLTRRPEAPRSLNPDIPEPLEAVILRCLEKRPSARYPDAGELERDLNRYLIKKEMGTASGKGLDLRSSAVARSLTEDDGLASRLRHLFAAQRAPGESPEERERRRAAGQMVLGLGSMALACGILWIGVRPSLPLLGLSPLWPLLAGEVLLAARGAQLLLLGDRVPAALRVGFVLAVAGAGALLLPLATGTSLEQVVVGEASLLRGDPWAHLVPMRAPFTFGRAVLTPLLALAFLLQSILSLQEERGDRALRELGDFALGAALTFSLGRCSLEVAAAAFGWR